ncbi:hypothetical protein DD567_26025 [Klebsiella pneumoniae]|nr:hypothetical protein DD567_26025 [Klebsiella pneumoniae]
MKQDVILVLDCGATNVRAMAVDRQGNIIARAATANASDIAAEKSDWHQWSLEAIMQRFADCCRQIHDQLASCTVRGITVTTFGVDGALVDEQGALLYPIISWKCPRTAAVMEKISQYMPARQLQRIAGVGAFAFNTLYKLVWLKEDHPQLLAQVAPANYRARIERLFLFHLQAFDWNCPQHITPRYSAQQVAEYSQNLQQRIHDLEQENQRLQQQLARRGE